MIATIVNIALCVQETRSEPELLWGPRRPWNTQLTAPARTILQLATTGDSLTPACPRSRRLSRTSSTRTRTSPPTITKLPLNLNPSLPSICQSSYEPHSPSWYPRTKPSLSRWTKKPYLFHSSVPSPFPASVPPQPLWEARTRTPRPQMTRQAFFPGPVPPPLNSLSRTAWPRDFPWYPSTTPPLTSLKRVELDNETRNIIPASWQQKFHQPGKMHQTTHLVKLTDNLSEPNTEDSTLISRKIIMLKWRRLISRKNLYKVYLAWLSKN